MAGCWGQRRTPLGEAAPAAANPQALGKDLAPSPGTTPHFLLAWALPDWKVCGVMSSGPVLPHGWGLLLSLPGLIPTHPQLSESWLEGGEEVG